MQYFSQFAAQGTPAFLFPFLPIITILVIWSLVMKGFALWHAARGNQKWWYIAMLVINTIGILELVYLIWFRPSASSTPAQQSSSQA